MRGPIVPGDDEKITRFYKANHPFLGGFLLISQGGNVEAAKNIGRLFRRYLIHAFAPVDFGRGQRERSWMNGNGELVNWCAAVNNAFVRAPVP